MGPHLPSQHLQEILFGIGTGHKAFSSTCCIQFLLEAHRRQDGDQVQHGKQLQGTDFPNLGSLGNAGLEPLSATFPHSVVSASCKKHQKAIIKPVHTMQHMLMDIILYACGGKFLVPKDLKCVVKIAGSAKLALLCSDQTAAHLEKLGRGALWLPNPNSASQIAQTFAHVPRPSSRSP